MLANLIDNAIRHAGSGAAIVIGLHRRGKRIVGCVSDSGLGVPTTEHELIFRRFHRSPESHSVSGSGLGLSLVKAVADMHGIAVSAEDATPGLRIVMRFYAVSMDKSREREAARRLWGIQGRRRPSA